MVISIRIVLEPIKIPLIKVSKKKKKVHNEQSDVLQSDVVIPAA